MRFLAGLGSLAYLATFAAPCAGEEPSAPCDSDAGEATCTAATAKIGRENVLLQHAVLVNGQEAIGDSLQEDATARRRRKRRRSSKTRRRRGNRRRRRTAKKQPKSTTKLLLKADAIATKVEAGWANHVSTKDSFTAFIIGSKLDPKKDRVIVIKGDDSCGAGSAKLAAVTGNGEVPGQRFAFWKALPCDGTGSSGSKLACGPMNWSDDGYVDAYKFKVCVCDHSKRGNCDSKEAFDLQPATPTLFLNPVV